MFHGGPVGTAAHDDGGERRGGHGQQLMIRCSVPCSGPPARGTSFSG
jgi:hypothetical protein